MGCGPTGADADVAVGGGDVAGGLVGVASSLAHAKATTNIVTVKTAIIGLNIDVLRESISHPLNLGVIEDSNDILIRTSCQWS